MQGYGADVIDYVPDDISKFDARVTLFNSMHIMGHLLQTIPSAPCLKGDFQFSGRRMGIAWSGNSRQELNLSSFLSRLNTTGFEVYALQRGEVIDPVIQLKARDFKETAALMRTLDVIVTVDTAAAHLAGAIGHPNTHVVVPYNRDWRWWNKDVWYPTLNVYPQDTSGDWDKPFQRVNEEIHQ